MNHLIKKALVTVALSLGFAAGNSAIAPTAAHAQEYYNGEVPAYYVASTEPVYYNGYAHYWYNNHWYYRDGARWRYYGAEPAYFRDYRGRYPRGHYGHWR
jgi:hypothetical protein